VAVARPDLDDEFDEDEFVDEFGADEPAEQSEPWHNSTKAVVGASAAALAAIGVVVAAVMYVSGGDEPADAPVGFVDPSFSEAPAASSTTTTTETITSTPTISTTEINAPTGPSTTSGTSGTSASSGTESPGAPTFTRPPRPRQDGDNTGGPTSRSRPRLNVTRTLGPG
jgi:hypothetical protein